MSTSAQILPNERELFALIARGDQKAFTKIFDHYEPRIYPFIFKMTRSEIIAEEVVQEIFIRLWTTRANLANVENPRSYIFRMATNRASDHLRSLARQAGFRVVPADDYLELNSTELAFDAKEMQVIISRVVEQLPPQQKKVYKLSREEGKNYDEIAQELNISRHTAKNHLTEALRFIKERLQQSPGTAIALIIFLVKNSR